MLPCCSIHIQTYVYITRTAWLHVGGANSVRLDLFTRLIGRVVSQFWDFIIILNSKIVVNDVANNQNKNAHKPQQQPQQPVPPQQRQPDPHIL